MKKLTVILLFVGLFVLIVFAISHSFAGHIESRSAKSPCNSIATSKARGAFVGSVTIEPSSFKFNGKQITILESWLEHRTELIRIKVFVPFIWEQPQYHQIEGYNLCLKLDEASYAAAEMFFVEEGKGQGFTRIGTVVMYQELSDLAKLPTKILATTNWKLEKSQVLSIKREQK